MKNKYIQYLQEAIHSEREYIQYIKNSENKEQALKQLIRKYPKDADIILSQNVLRNFGNVDTAEQLVTLVDYLDYVSNQEKYLSTLSSLSNNPIELMKAIYLSVAVDDKMKKRNILQIIEQNKEHIQIQDIPEEVYNAIHNNAMFVLYMIPQVKEGMKGNEIRGQRLLYITSKGLKSKYTRDTVIKTYNIQSQNIFDMLLYIYEKGFNSEFFSQFYDLLLNLDTNNLYVFLRYSKNSKTGDGNFTLEDMLVNSLSTIDVDDGIKLIQIAYQGGKDANLIDSPKALLTKIEDDKIRNEVAQEIFNQSYDEIDRSQLMNQVDEYVGMAEDYFFDFHNKAKAKEMLKFAKEIWNKDNGDVILGKVISKIYNKYPEPKKGYERTAAFILVIFQYMAIDMEAQERTNFLNAIGTETYGKMMELLENIYPQMF